MSKVYSKIKDKSSEIEKEIYLMADGVCCSLFSIQSLATILHNNGIDNKQLSSRLGKRAKLKRNQYQLQPLNFCRTNNKERNNNE